MRWIQIFKTSPSGKTLFVCRGCGRVTPAPGPCSEKPELPDWHRYHGLSCEEIERKEEDSFLHPILMNAVVRSKMLVADIQGKGVRAAQRAVKHDRKSVCDTLIVAMNRAMAQWTAQDRGRVWDAIDTVRQELVKK